MIKRPLLLGANGNMGRRYQAILKALDRDFLKVDCGDEVPKKGFDGVLIATPTMLHVQHVSRFLESGLPILVEKPLSTNLAEVLRLCDEADESGLKLQMVNQYRYLKNGLDLGHAHTFYHYFKSGQDGLVWDCINIVGLAKGKVQLSLDSPIWFAAINGHGYQLSDMDRAYVDMLNDWLCSPRSETDYIRRAHRKVMEVLECQS